MRRRDYIEAALLGRPTDRIPCWPLVDVAFASAYAGVPMSQVQLDVNQHATALAKCARELPIDGVYINLCLAAHQAAGAVRRGDGYDVRMDGAVDLRIPENDVASISATEIVRLDDPRIEQAEIFHPGMLATFRAIPADVHDTVAVCVGFTGTFCQLAFLYGVQNLMMAMIDDPDSVRRAMDRRHKVALEQAKELCQACARFVWIGEGVASSSLISPRMYEEFVLPYEQELARELRRGGALSILHICGNTTPALDKIARSQADGYDVDSPTDWESAVRIAGPAIVLKGNINPSLFLEGCEKELSIQCVKTRDSARGCKGFIMSTGCLVPRDSSVAAFRTMAKVCSAE